MFRKVRHFFFSTPHGMELLPCSSPTCYRPQCRALAVVRNQRAMTNGLRHARYTYLLTITHLSSPVAVREAYRASLACLRAFCSRKIEAALVIERHKSNGKYHGHIAISSPAPFSLKHVNFRGKGWNRVREDLSLYSQAHLVARPPHSIASYLLKVARKSCATPDTRQFHAYLLNNFGRVVAASSQGFYRPAGGKREANKREGKRGVAYRRMEHYLSSKEAATALTAGHITAEQILMRLSLIRIFDRLSRRFPYWMFLSSPLMITPPAPPVLEIDYPLRL